MRQRLRAMVRRLPGYPRARDAIVRNEAVRRLAQRIVTGGAVQAGRVPQLLGGRAFSSEQAAGMPIVLLVTEGLDEPEVEQLAGMVEEAQRLTAGFVPVFVLDTPHFGPLRRRGYAVEHLLSADAWQDVGDPSQWTDYRIARLAGLRRDYGASGFALIRKGAIPPVRALALLAAHGTHPP